ncbi:ABC transporter substrate-binding protein [Geomonas sp.]|uniref:ABC transporter substrate-binding protein n=1 Tax=Geomonas sp. TaxID=2651584 RepID=UPI002B48E4BF|nr:ABC transporter substrate-binding protein [Geomonas sp.]HJV34571.1 ABC transporter substrate-binding protein [Geomonas sp.]
MANHFRSGRGMRALLLVLAVLCAFTGASSWGAQRKVRKVAMILFRGETPSEQGFKDTVHASRQFQVRCRTFDAGQRKERLQEILATLDPSKYDLIYTFGTVATQSAMERFKDVPIVYNVVQRPVEAGVIRNWLSSGNNVTGASNIVGMESAFKTLALVMNIRKLGFIYSDKDPASQIQREELKKLQGRFGFRIVDLPVHGMDSIGGAIGQAVAAKVDAVFFPADSFIKATAGMIVPALNEHRIPTVAVIPELVRENGALISLGPDYYELGQVAARNALEVLAGKRPTEVPSRTVHSLHICINLKTADRLGITFPLQLLSMSTVVR